MNYLGRDITKLSNQIKRSISTLSTKAGLSGAQGQVLHYIIAQHQDDVFQKDIEEEFNLRPATASGLLKALEADNYIYRTSMAHDARLKKIVLTDKAKKVGDNANIDIINFEQRLINDITKEDLVIFKKVINQMKNNISE